MTREKAIERLNNAKGCPLLYDSHIEALEMAISALEQELCDDAISREDTKKHIKDRLYETACNNTTYQCYADEVFADIAEHRIETWINELPSVTQKSGHWIREVDFGNCLHYICSECENEGENSDYCPYCGAEMVEPQESEEISERNMKMWEGIFKAESEEQTE